ncbi:hypothetical protein COCNU_11G000020 [Cocos nucifera]|uniref:Uncharacterized protein n=1 Tax=Cocos nucifera TaxID=13894 RepID=A0A8K0IN96_COCNU|nr:hypothetical protein COCNU_11G000020 [Cocos nucifera]
MFSSFYSLISVAHDVSALERGFRSYADICQGWSDKARVAIAEKNAALERLHAAVDREREAKEWEKKMAEEVSRLKVELESVRADLGSTNFELELACSKLESA